MSCKAEVRRIYRAVDREIRGNPEWFDRCWRIHDQPALDDTAGRRFMKSREQAWWEHYDDIATYVRRRGGALPAQNDSTRARVLYGWIEAQRRQYNAGTLAQDRVDAVNRLGEWVGARKGNPDALRGQRLKEVRQFRADGGRFPIYDPQRHSDEKDPPHGYSDNAPG